MGTNHHKYIVKKAIGPVGRKVLSVCGICFYLLTMVSLTQAQRPTDFGQGIRSGPLPQDNQEDEGPDTTIYQYVLLDHIFQKINVADTTADIGFLHRHPMYREGHELIHTGNSGSATSSLIYTAPRFYGFNTGYVQYVPYHITPGNFRFYEQNRPVTNLYFSQLANQDNIEVGAAFSRNFSQGLSISLNYNRIIQRGIYQSQNIKSTAFGVGLRYKSTNDRYHAILLYIHNANEENNNGGITGSEELNTSFRRAVPVILGGAATRQQEKSIAFTQIYKLLRPESGHWNLYMQHDFRYQPSYFKYSDPTITGNDTLFYPLTTLEKRGIRRYLDIQHYSNGLYIHGTKGSGINGKAGLLLDHFTITDIPEKTNRTDLTAVAEGSIPVFRSLRIETSAKIGLLRNIGNFHIRGNINTEISKYATLSGALDIFRSDVSYNMQQLRINETTIMDTSLTKPFGTTLQVNLNIPGIRFSAGLSQSVITNPVYWNEAGKAINFDGVFTATYFRVKQNFKFRGLNLDNQGHVQLFSAAIYPLPSFYSTHQLYITGHLFKKALAFNAGIDTRFIADYSGPAYQPLLGTFLPSNTLLPFFPAANAFFMARVSDLRVALVMENVSQYFIKDINFDVVHHPQFDPIFRMSFQWLLKD